MRARIPENEALKLGHSARRLGEIVPHGRTRKDKGQGHHQKTPVFLSRACLTPGGHWQCSKINCPCDCHRRGA